MVTLPANSIITPPTPPGGTEFEIQYNNGSNGFAGATGFVYDPANSRVGINKNPSYALDVLGDINATSTIRLGGDQIITSSKNIDNVVNINATGDLTLGGNLGQSGTFTVGGAATFNSTVGVTGAATFNSTVGVTGAVTFSSTLEVSSTSYFNGAIENGTITASAPSSTTNFDVLSQSIQYYTTNATTNWTLNVRGNSGISLAYLLDATEAITIVLMVECGSTAYYMTTFQVDGYPYTPKWQGGATPSAGYANATNIYSITIMKNSAGTGYHVFASLVKFA
jgi:hypothetical protein